MMATKLAIDQCVIIPLELLMFFILNELLQNNGMRAVFERIKSDYVDVMMKNWQVWPPAQLINFYLIPLLFRTIFVRLVSFFWSIYLSWKAHKIYDE